MKKQLVIIGIIALLLCVGLSGCNQISNPLSNEKTLPGGTKVTGDTGQIQIIEQNFSKKRIADWTQGQQTWRLDTDGKFYPLSSGDVPLPDGTAEVPLNLNITNIDNDLAKRKDVYLSYVHSNESDWQKIQEENIPIAFYTGYLTSKYKPMMGTYKYFYDIIDVSNFALTNKEICHVNGTAKNIGNNYIYTAEIIVNFYNANKAWLASVTDYHQDIPSSYTWDFNVKYDGKFVNDVNYISFNVSAL